MLAVDALNAPAIAAYERALFLAWDRRSVLLKVLTLGNDGRDLGSKNNG